MLLGNSANDTGKFRVVAKFDSQPHYISEALEMLYQGKADMIGSFLGTDNEGAQMELAVTKPYAVLNDIIARNNKSVTFP